jgi:hypothetical protein
MEVDHAWLEDEPLDIAVVPRTALPLISVGGPASGPRNLTALETWIGQIVQAIVEIVGGDRPLTQAVRWTSPRVYQQLGRRAAHLGKVGGYAPGVGRVQRVRPRVTGVTSSTIDQTIVEAAVTIRTGQRARAVAVRFEQSDARWICTVLDFGEASPARGVSVPRALRDTA